MNYASSDNGPAGLPLDVDFFYEREDFPSGFFDIEIPKSKHTIVLMTKTRYYFVNENETHPIQIKKHNIIPMLTCFHLAHRRYISTTHYVSAIERVNHIRLHNEI